MSSSVNSPDPTAPPADRPATGGTGVEGLVRSWSQLDRRVRLVVVAVAAVLVVALVVGAGAVARGALARDFEQVQAEEVLPATNTGLGRAVSAMKDLHYLCTEGKSSREGMRVFVCTGQEGWADIEATAAGAVVYLALAGREGQMTAERARAIGRALVNGSELNQDAKIAARSVVDGTSTRSDGPWGVAATGAAPYRLVYIAADRPQSQAQPGIGPAAALAQRLGKQCRTTTPTVAPPTVTPAPVVATVPGEAPATSPVTTCSASDRFVGTTTTYVRAGDAVTSLTVTSSAPVPLGWTHTEAVEAMRLALTDLGLDEPAVGAWFATNHDRQGTAYLGTLRLEVNLDSSRAATSLRISRAL